MNSRRALHGLLVLGAAAAAAASAAVASAPVREEFAFAAPVQLDGTGPAYQLALPLHVFRYTVRPGRADLRVVNADGEVVPYALLDGELAAAPAEPRKATLPFYPLRGNVSQGLAALRLSVHGSDGTVVVASGGAKRGRQLLGYLFDARALEAAVSGWSFQWDEPRADFDVTVSLQASDDLLHWEPVAAGVLADLRQGERRFVRSTLAIAPRKARYWRLGWDAPVAPLALSAATVELQGDAAAPRRETLIVTAAALAGQPGEYRFEVPGRVPVERVNVRLPFVNSVAAAAIASRGDATDPWRGVARLDLYRVAPARGGAAEIHNGEAIIGTNTDPLWQVRIEPANAVQGVAELKLDLGWRPRALVKRAAALRITAGYGNARAIDAAVPAATLLAGLNDLKFRRRRAPTSPASLGVPALAGGLQRLEPPPPPLPWKRWILWGVLVVGALLLLVMAARLARSGE
ncbi:MAG: DUF3999 family protein [Steroidobacteraceae bacterium]